MTGTAIFGYEHLTNVMRKRKDLPLKILAAIALSLAISLAWNPLTLAYTLSSTDWSYASFPVAQFQGYTSGFAPKGRTNPVTGRFVPHWGLDIAAPEGSAIVSFWDGTVVSVKIKDTGCGNEVTTKHGRWESRHCHCQTVLVKPGQFVSSGQAIATVGQTGGATGPHDHWEVYFNGRILDPARVISAMQKATR